MNYKKGSAYVPCALTCLTCLVPYMLLCLTCHLPFLLPCLTCLLPYVFSISCVSHPMCFCVSRATCPTCSVSCVPRASRAPMPYVSLLPRLLCVSCANPNVCTLVFSCLTWFFLLPPISAAEIIECVRKYMNGNSQNLQSLSSN